jgi:hypothetical protein
MSNGVLRDFLYSHHRLYYLFLFFRRFRQKEYFENLNITATQGGMNRTFRFVSYGDLNKDKPLYLIKKDSGHNAAFGAYYLQTVMYLAIADFFGFTPVVEWKSLMLQKDDHAPGGDNIFEYFYEQPCGISVDEAMNSYHVALATGHSIVPQETYYDVVLNDTFSLYGKSAERLLRLTPPIQAYVSERVNSILEGKKTLGVHVRGGGYKTANNYHAVGVEPTEHLAEAKKAVAEHGFERIFLATDEEDVVKMFKDAFGQMVVYYGDVVRNPPGVVAEVLMTTMDKTKPRPDHGYRLLFEVLADVYTLAACQGLIAGLTNVPMAAVYANGDRFEYRRFINKGIYGYDVPSPRSKNTLVKKGERQYKKLERESK